MTVLIELTPQDNLASTIARLKANRTDAVAFLVPAGLEFSDVDLRVLRREAAVCGQGLALVTSDPSLRSKAGRAGIHTFREGSSLDRARLRQPRVDRRRRSRPVGAAEALPPPGPGLYGKHSPTGLHPVTFLRSFVRRRGSWWAPLGVCCALLVLFAGFLVALSYIIPEAMVTVVPASEPLQVTVSLRAVQDAEADSEAGVVPARGVSAQIAGDGRMATTGRRYEPSAKATGQVVMMNRTARPLTIPTGTVVSTATGNNVRFVTTTEGKLEPNGRTTVPIQSDLPGLSGNVRAGTITEVEGPLSLAVVVSNESATGGGGSSQVAVVTEEDKEKLQAQLYEELKQKALEKLNERLPAGSFVPPESVQYLAMSPTFTPFVGDVSPDLFLSMSVQAVGLVVDTRAGNDVALERLQRAMPPGSRLVADSVRYIPGSVVVEDEKAVAFSITAVGTLLRGFNTGAARSAILGLTPEDASRVLQARFALASAPEIHLGPDWLPLIVPTDLPSLAWRIRFRVDWDQATAVAIHR